MTSTSTFQAVTPSFAKNSKIMLATFTCTGACRLYPPSEFAALDRGSQVTAQRRQRMSKPFFTDNPFEQTVVRIQDNLRAQSEQWQKELRARCNSDERRIVLSNVPWSAYVALRDA